MDISGPDAARRGPVRPGPSLSEDAVRRSSGRDHHPPSSRRAHRAEGESSMRVWCRAIIGGLLSLILSGCEAPTDIVPVTPPGAVFRRQSPDPETPQAQGEMAAPM